MTIHLTEIRVSEDAERLVLDVLRSGRLAQGIMVEQFEHLFADAAGTSHAIAVSNGTAALIAALRTLGIGHGDEVIVPAFTFGATLNAVLETGARAVCVDIDDSFTIDVDAVEAAITGSTAAVIPVHLYGYPADMVRLNALSARRGIRIVEDAAQALGATYNGKAVGSFGVGCFSTYATKTVFTGEGGVITTDDDHLAAELRVFRNQGMEGPYRYVASGVNLRLTDLAAAVAVPQLEQLSTTILRRAANAERLNAQLSCVDQVVTPEVRAPRTHSWHQYTVRISRSERVNRDELAALLEGEGVESRVYYPRALSQYDCFNSHPRVKFTGAAVAETAASEVLSLPVHQWLSDSDVDRISSLVTAAYRA